MQIVIEPLAKALHLSIEFFFSGMGKRRVPDVVSKGERFREFLVQTEGNSQGPGYLNDFDCMGEPVPEVVVETRSENLCFILQATKRTGMDDTVAVPLEFVPVWMRQFGIAPALRPLNRKPEARQDWPAHD
jgi:hypothetical protein